MIWRANQWPGDCLIGTSVMKELMKMWLIDASNVQVIADREKLLQKFSPFLINLSAYRLWYCLADSTLSKFRCLLLSEFKRIN